jgi:glycosyltransferase involved in cell wall biosynthesis
VAAVETARALVKRGCDLIGVAARHRRPARPPYSPPIPVAQLPLSRVALYESWHRVRRPKVQRATGPVDVIHATAIAIPPPSAPLVVTIHDLAWLHEPAHFTRRGRSFFNRGLALAKRDADLVLCPSQTTHDDCLIAGFDSQRLMVVPFGVATVRASAHDVSTVARRYGIDRPYIMWTGTIEPRKNLRGLVDAWRSLEFDVDLVLVGPRGWNEDIDALIGLARDRIHLLGFVPNEDLSALYAGAAVFCYPSFLEGFGFPVLEAMAQGAPVVTSAGTSTEELVGDAGILVNPADGEAIANGIRSVLEDGALAAKLKAAGIERAAKYSWDRTAELVNRAYEKVAK